MSQTNIEKDWTGNSRAIYTTLGASNHTNKEREPNDYYATDPKAIHELLKYESFNPCIWEVAVGGGHMADALEEHLYVVRGSDIIDRGWAGTEIIDFLECEDSWDGDIITNPPYKYALEFVEKALNLIRPGAKVAMFLKLTFLEGKKRKLFDDNYPVKKVYAFSERINCSHGGTFKEKSSAVAYAWFVWEKGYQGDTIIKRI